MRFEYGKLKMRENIRAFFNFGSLVTKLNEKICKYFLKTVV